jgi:hypothetical protein
MKRREFITLLGGTAAWPLAVCAQQPQSMPVLNTEASAVSADFVAPDLEGLGILDDASAQSGGWLIWSDGQ